MIKNTDYKIQKYKAKLNYYLKLKKNMRGGNNKFKIGDTVTYVPSIVNQEILRSFQYTEEQINDAIKSNEEHNNEYIGKKGRIVHSQLSRVSEDTTIYVVEGELNGQFQEGYLELIDESKSDDIFVPRESPDEKNE